MQNKLNKNTNGIKIDKKKHFDNKKRKKAETIKTVKIRK